MADMRNESHHAFTGFETCERDFVNNDCDQSRQGHTHRALMENGDAGQRQSEQNEIDWNTEHRGILHARKPIADSSYVGNQQFAIGYWLSTITLGSCLPD